MRDMSSVATLFNMSSPKDGREILRRASNGSHGTWTSIILVLKVIFGFSEIYDLNLSILRAQKQVSRLEISVTDTNLLQVR